MSARHSISPRPKSAEVAACYTGWANGYYDEYYGPDAPYPPVHLDLIRAVLHHAGARRVLDVGCGPASMMRHLAQCGMDVSGFDLTPAMVQEARRTLTAMGLDAQRVWQGNVTDAESYRHPSGHGQREMRPYDAAICVGVLPHVKAGDEALIFANLREAVRPGGLVMIEARNQLFSLFTMNRPTHEFIVNDLIRAEELRHAAPGERAALEIIFGSMRSHVRIDLPLMRDGRGGGPGYDAITSRSHNPLLLRQAMVAAGFENVDVLFYHYHCLPPMFESQVPAFFRERSLAMEDPHDWRGYFMASAFFVAGTRA